MAMSDEHIEILIPSALLEKIDSIGEILDFKSREEFILASIRRLLDWYALLIKPLQPEKT
jgi:metal-responsive CopG/Arc/MetJ family transcriptional regulator